MSDFLQRLRVYSPLFALVVVTVALCALLIPRELFTDHWRGASFAFLCGTLVGLAEIASRYRDEPLKATSSLYGLIYLFLNGAISVLSLLLIFKKEIPGVASGDGLLAAITAGFGSAAIMRTRFAAIKTADDREISIGPDFVITTLLQMFDRNVDRQRAERRQSIVIKHLPEIRALGSFSVAAKYLFASLLAFQNLDETLKSQLSVTVTSYEQQTLPEDIKYLAIGFVFLTIVGEANFAAILNNAVKIKLPSPPPPATPPPATGAAA